MDLLLLCSTAHLHMVAISLETLPSWLFELNSLYWFITTLVPSVLNLKFFWEFLFETHPNGSRHVAKL